MIDITCIAAMDVDMRLLLLLVVVVVEMVVV